MVVLERESHPGYHSTGRSVALFSDALESIVNVAAAIAALIAVYYAAQPADERHPYGHHKAEFFSAVLEGAMIIVAALVIFHEAWQAFQNPRPLDAPVVVVQPPPVHEVARLGKRVEDLR